MCPGALLMLSCNLGDVCGSLLPLAWRWGCLQATLVAFQARSTSEPGAFAAKLCVLAKPVAKNLHDAYHVISTPRTIERGFFSRERKRTMTMRVRAVRIAPARLSPAAVS